MSVEDFKDLAKGYYWNLDWIDAFTGSLFETPVEGGEVGELNAEIIADQFKKLKDGDRFFYSHKQDSGRHVPGLGNNFRNNIWRYQSNNTSGYNFPMITGEPCPEYSVMSSQLNPT